MNLISTDGLRPAVLHLINNNNASLIKSALNLSYLLL